MTQTVMGSNFDHDPSSNFFQKDPTSSICVFLLTNNQTDKWINGHENKSLMKIINTINLLRKGHMIQGRADYMFIYINRKSSHASSLHVVLIKVYISD